MAAKTRWQKVSWYLIDRYGKWVPGYALTAPEVGGSEGLRRLRELRQRGYVVQKRRMAKSSAFEYRIGH